MIPRLVLIGTCSALGLLSGLAPALLPQAARFEFNAVASAQAPTPQISNYAKAAFEIEQIRQREYADAKRIMGGNVPGDVCRQQDIPRPVQDICNRFMTNSAAIIKKNGLSVAEFNDLTRRKDTEPLLQQQIQNELLRLQKK